MTSKQRQPYTGSCYIGVVGAELEYGECHDSIDRIQRRAGDDGPHYYRATKGYEARQAHVNRFMDSHHAFLLLLDSDMVFPPDALERLRSHGMPYATGLYMRRRYAPIAPVWFRLPPKNAWPMEPYLEDPERGKLHPLGAAGWGCTLVHRDVIVAVRAILKGEPEILEDDMDVWPYDLRAAVQAIAGLREIASTKPKLAVAYPALEHHLSVLETEIRPLRAIKNETVGSDIRFPFYAREAGFILMGDPDCRAAHMLNYPLTPDDYSGTEPEGREATRKDVAKQVIRERKRLRQAVAGLGGAG